MPHGFNSSFIVYVSGEPFSKLHHRCSIGQRDQRNTGLRHTETYQLWGSGPQEMLGRRKETDQRQASWQICQKGNKVRLYLLHYLYKAIICVLVTF